MRDWEVLERNSERGFWIMGRQHANGWIVAVHFDDDMPVRHDNDHTYKKQEDAIAAGRAIAAACGK